jgi:hypothetical protein
VRAAASSASIGLLMRTFITFVVVAVAGSLCAAASGAPDLRSLSGSARGSTAPERAVSAVAPLPTLVPPDNDAFASAATVTSLPFQAGLATVEATTAADDPFCEGNAASVWYAYTPPVTTWLTASTLGSDYDTTLSAYTGSPGSLSSVACNNDTGGLQSQVTFLASAGVTYYLMAAGVSGGGNLVLSVDVRFPIAQLAVRTTRAHEITPAAAAGQLAWAQGPRRNFRFWSLFVKPSGEARRKVNRLRTHGYSGGFDGERFVYQEVTRRQSNLQLYDLADRRRSAPAGVNTRHWEWHPTLSGDWLLFGRTNVRQRIDFVVLRNLATGETRVLDRLPWGFRKIAEPGQVSGNYVTWYRCVPTCDVFRYDIAAQTTSEIPNPGGHQYDPSVTDDGTVYFVRSGFGCGVAVRLVRQPIDGPRKVLTQLTAGRDSFHTYALENANGTTSLYFHRNNCRTDANDVLRIIDP